MKEKDKKQNVEKCSIGLQTDIKQMIKQNDEMLDELKRQIE